tara:strand:+ start:66 stop:320 length:255 start_codon:yes stop_codon:yes gene_type:complete
MGSRHKHTRFVNACVKYLKEENEVETTEGLIDNVTNYKGLPYTNTPSANQLAQLLARDSRFKQVDTTAIPSNKGTYDIALWGLK